MTGGSIILYGSSGLICTVNGFKDITHQSVLHQSTGDPYKAVKGCIINGYKTVPGVCILNIGYSRWKRIIPVTSKVNEDN